MTCRTTNRSTIPLWLRLPLRYLSAPVLMVVPVVMLVMVSVVMLVVVPVVVLVIVTFVKLRQSVAVFGRRYWGNAYGGATRRATSQSPLKESY